ncbi:ABC transporter ATP-binding protein/permease [Staphylococcus agnetis]|uniref:ABC transporter ATP-binding protein/permease n=1 Tax=Staphylococcus agnetis TaxID=985762 RepID=A0ABD7TVI7_9STAP|nr:ABC transporter ATP-binding protein [Staphylococcus agnetis]UXU57071.1 ABC transporter ATP-binding protein/permease [Staphylococcus agnetis]
MSNPLLFLLKKVQWPKGLMLIGILLTIISSILSLIIPVISRDIIDNFNFNMLNLFNIIIFASIFLLSSIFEGISLYLLSKIGEETIYSIREKLWEHLICLDISFFDNNSTGELMSRINSDTTVINTFISERAPTSINSLITLFGSVGLLFFLDWKLTLLAFLVMPVFIIVLIPLSKSIGYISEETQSQIAKFNDVLSKSLYNIRLIKASSFEDVEINNAKNNLKNIYNLGLKESLIRSILSPISSLLIMITAIVVLGYGGYRVSNGEMTAGTLVAMIFYILKLTEPFLNLSLFFTDYYESIGASKRIFDIYDENIEKYNNNFDRVKGEGAIKFENVTFTYNNDKTVLEDISFSIEKGSFTAIVGPSGSGKTTILNLIERFYEPTEGNILYNDKKIKEYNLKKWREHIGFVMQTNTIVPGTIKENILYGVRREVTEEEIVTATKDANCYKFIMGLPNKFDTYVGEQGVKLSGGQKQRIQIARIFIKNAPILIFDEATASLDSDSEQKIQNSMNILSSKKTIVVIAHRLSTIVKADKIIFLDDGKITGCGSHDYLMKNHEKYYNFVQKQGIID